MSFTIYVPGGSATHNSFEHYEAIKNLHQKVSSKPIPKGDGMLKMFYVITATTKKKEKRYVGACEGGVYLSEYAKINYDTSLFKSLTQRDKDMLEVEEFHLEQVDLN
jgi:hypothetical protein